MDLSQHNHALRPSAGHRRTIVAAAMAVLLLGACGGSEEDAEPTVAAAGDAPAPVSTGVVDIDYLGKVSIDGEPVPADSTYPGQDGSVPAPFGTEFRFKGWTMEVLSAEVTTQPLDGDPDNPAAVVQMEVRIQAPTDAALLEEQATVPFEPNPYSQGSDMLPCEDAQAEPPQVTAGEEATLTTCHYGPGLETLNGSMPLGTIDVRYADYSHVTAVYTEMTRGVDY